MYSNSCILWNIIDVYYTALKRFPCDCAICMLPVGVTASIAHTSRVPDIPLVDTENAVAVKNHKMYIGKKEIILSCSHVFHAKCIANFERFLQATVRIHNLFICYLYELCS